MDKKLHYQYVAIHIAYWASTVGAVGFAVPVLQDQGIDAGIIGILLTVRAVLSVFFQPVFANLFDRFGRRISLNNLIAIMIIVSIAATIVQITNPSIKGMFALFTLYGIFTFGMISFIDALSSLFLYQKKKVHYPIARYAGSLSYALLALVVGYLSSASAILLTQVFSLSILLFLILKIDRVYSVMDIHPAQNETDRSFFSLLRKYPIFLFFLLATCFSFIGKEMSGNFLVDVYRSVGGTVKDYGLGISIMAFSEVPMVVVFSRMLHRLGIEKLMFLSFFFASLRIFIIVVAPNVSWLNFAQVFQFLGTGAFWAGNVQFVQSVLPSNSIVRAQSAIGICYLGVGSGAGSFLSGLILKHTNLTILLVVSFLFSLLGTLFMFIGNRQFNKTNVHSVISELSVNRKLE